MRSNRNKKSCDQCYYGMCSECGVWTDILSEVEDVIIDGVSKGIKKFYDETGDDCKTYYQLTKEAAERM